MYILILYAITFLFLGVAGYKANKHLSEWIILLVLLSFIKTCVMYLFGGTTVFTLVTIGSTQVHLDDVILIWFLFFFVVSFLVVKQKKSAMLVSTLLLIIPMGISLMRGVLHLTIGTASFLSDTRKFILFFVTLFSFYVIFRRDKTFVKKEKYVHYLHSFMNVVLVYVFIVWTLDLVLGMNFLPGQIVGTLSDGGSTFRIIAPSQVLAIAIYTVLQIKKDIFEKRLLSLRTLTFVIMIILLQWRTVVLSFAAGILVLIGVIVFEGKFLSRKLLTQNMLLFIAGLVFSIVGGKTNISGMITNLFESISSIALNTGTFSTRTMAWRILLGSLNGFDRYIGRPFGLGIDETVTWHASAHSGYVDYIMVTGYVGVICLVIFMISILIRAIRTRNIEISIIIAMLLVYWGGYGISIEQAAIIGGCMAMIEIEAVRNESGINMRVRRTV